MNPALIIEMLARLMALGAQYNDLLSDIREQDPEMWAKVVAKYGASAAGWKASVERQRAAAAAPGANDD